MFRRGTKNLLLVALANELQHNFSEKHFFVDRYTCRLKNATKESEYNA
jgi:hypothetical protein